MPNLAIYTDHSDLIPSAYALAERLSLPFAEVANSYDYLLTLTPNDLALHSQLKKTLALKIDFLTGAMTYRRQHATFKRESIARALGLKKNKSVKIIDATAGLARDSFIIASLGFDIILLERSPIIHALLEDGIKRARLHPEVAPIIDRMQLIHIDALSWMQKVAAMDKPDIIYLDPMFPTRTKSALVKKEMRIFHDLLGCDDDADDLLKGALSCATQRVVVKRPRLAENLASHKPSFSQTGSSNRFDIYLI
jgi:16S rRNA (guanine1516-N2)-methyltransferase